MRDTDGRLNSVESTLTPDSSRDRLDVDTATVDRGSKARYGSFALATDRAPMRSVRAPAAPVQARKVSCVMSRIRVLVVDDAVVFRKVLSDVLGSDPEIEVVGTAQNGQLGLAKIEQLNPDLVTLDVEMPIMDGLQTLGEIRKRWPRLPVVMFSTLTSRGAESTLDAIALGASDYAAKPNGMGSSSEAIERVRAELLPKVKALVQRARSVAARVSVALPTAPKLPSLLRPPLVRETPQILAIGSSTGGPNALADVLRALPKDFGLPVVITQHMPPVFTRLLAERLSRVTPIPVVEATDGAVLRPGQALIAPGDRHMTFVRRGPTQCVHLDDGPPENFCRPSVDVMLRSCVDVYGGHVLAVVLTGMGQDGLRGSERVRQAGGEIYVQDEETSVVWGMPGSIAAAGLADRVLPLAEIGAAIMRRLSDPRARATDTPRREVTRP